MTNTTLTQLTKLAQTGVRARLQGHIPQALKLEAEADRMLANVALFEPQLYDLAEETYRNTQEEAIQLITPYKPTGTTTQKARNGMF